jgi:hypothetical protein
MPSKFIIHIHEDHSQTQWYKRDIFHSFDDKQDFAQLISTHNPLQIL